MYSKLFQEKIRDKIWHACIAMVFIFNLNVALAFSSDQLLAKSWKKTPEADLALISATKTFNQQTASALLGIQFKLYNNWKIFWRSPGPAGVPPNFDWQASKNIKSIKTLWPYPKYHTLFEQHSVVYDQEVVFPVQIKIKNPLEKALIVLKIEYVLCRRDGCIPREQLLKLPLYPGTAQATSNAEIIDTFIQKTPKLNHHELLDIEAAQLKMHANKKHELLVTVSSKTPFATPELFVETSEQLFFNRPTIYKKLNDSHFQFLIKVFQDNERNYYSPLLQNKIRLTLVNQKQAIEKHVIVTPHEITVHDLMLLLLITFLGGIILNFMPCVLPVLFIKIVDIVEDSTATRQRIRNDFLSTTFGIMVSFLLLASAPILLKYFGNTFVWGGQFQQPVFLVFMASILTIFACNFFGLFEINLFSSTQNKVANLQFNNDFLKHFFRGVFATLLATPCTAPFVGTALGFALSRGPWEILLIFLTMGLGFSLPYISIALFPGFEKIIPRPGKWMIKLRFILGLALVLTVLWLLSILVTQISRYASLLVILVLLSIVGVMMFKHFVAKITDRVFHIIIGLLLVGALIIPYVSFPNSPIHERDMYNDIWQPFALDDIPKHVAAGKIVFVDVTARWCLTCYFNKKFALDRKLILDVLREPDLVAMRADWTQRSEEITDYLKSYNRYAIPFNVVYSKKYPKGITLPELLTVDTVLETINRAKADKP